MTKEILHKFFNGKATFEEEVRIKTWMESSEQNRQEFFRERKIFDALLILDTTDSVIESNNRPRRIWLREVLKIASIILLTLVSTIALQNYIKSRQPIAMQSISVPAGQYIRLSLPDGTAVWLNARSTLRYPVSFNSSERRIELDGEAYFEVVKDEDHPFIVETDIHNVEVLGTKFNVESYSEKNNFITTLMEGKVQVYNQETPETKTLLNPDTKVVYENGKLNVYNVDDYTTYRWREGLICFKNASFASIMESFEKYYGVKVRIKNNNVNKHNYTGKFRQADGVDYALRVLQRDISFEYIKDDETQIITIK